MSLALGRAQSYILGWETLESIRLVLVIAGLAADHATLLKRRHNAGQGADKIDEWQGHKKGWD
ncbi:hypothetical protein ANO11243_093000 [Dothideomycetidae sp. 11243]|nr:hypothetical protein ANO11243_093000 [fungal sp. No.11243]